MIDPPLDQASAHSEMLLSPYTGHQPRTWPTPDVASQPQSMTRWGGDQADGKGRMDQSGALRTLCHGACHHPRLLLAVGVWAEREGDNLPVVILCHFSAKSKSFSLRDFIRSSQHPRS